MVGLVWDCSDLAGRRAMIGQRKKMPRYHWLFNILSDYFELYWLDTSELR